MLHVLMREEAVVEADFDIAGLRFRHPVDRALDLTSVRSVAATRGGIVGAPDFDDLAGGVLDATGAGDEVTPAETDFLSRGEAEILLLRDLHEVRPLDEQGLGERHLAAAGGRVLGVVLGRELLDLAFRVVLDDEADRIQHRHEAGGGLVEVVAHGVLEERDVGQRVMLGDADGLAELADGGRRIAATAQARDRWHAGIVPTGNALLLHELEQVAL